MKRFVAIVLALLSVHGLGFPQLKSQQENQPSVAHGLVRPAPSLSGLLGWFNPEDFLMRHSASFNYVSSGGMGLSMATYTNSMFYKISDPLNVRFDLSLQGSPFGQYGAANQGDFSRLYLSRAEMNYQPWENVHLKLLYRELPYGYYRWFQPSFYPTSDLFEDD